MLVLVLKFKLYVVLLGEIKAIRKLGVQLVYATLEIRYVVGKQLNRSKLLVLLQFQLALLLESLVSTRGRIAAILERPAALLHLLHLRLAQLGRLEVTIELAHRQTDQLAVVDGGRRAMVLVLGS